jgi:hypothetical protein
MSRRLSLLLVLPIAVALAASFALAAERRPKAEAAGTPAKTSQAWTLDEAVEQLRLNPQDVYLQYVALQLAHSEGKAKENEVAGLIQQMTERRWGWRGRDRQVDLFDLFTGASAVQEALQLDTMRARGEDAALGDPARNTVKIADLKGPTVKSHPWGKMLAAQTLGGKQPEVSPLSLCVPEDQLFIEFRSLTKMLEAIDVGDLWGAHLYNQASKDATTNRGSERLKTQLAIQTDPLARPFYDMVVKEVAVTSNDVFFGEGTDVTMLFSVKQPEVFKLRMDGFLAAAEKAHPEATRTTGKIGDIPYVQVSTPDRTVNAFSAYPKPDLHVRSNSKAAMERVLRAIAGGKGTPRLGDATEFKYIRTLMVRGDKREDGFVYLSDPFIRRLVGPEVKLTERRRLLCYNHLRMIGHAAMLYRTQYGRPPASLEELAEHGCAPAAFFTGVDGRVKTDRQLFCPCGGKYSLSADGATGVCSHHGRPKQLVPCCEVPLERVTEQERREYEQFVEMYSRYWRQFFDPIAVRLQVTPKQYRAETIILPLIDNSIYTGLAAVLGGEPEPLDALPVPKDNIFSLAVRLNKDAILKDTHEFRGFLREFEYRGVTKRPGSVSIEEFLRDGIGNQISMHVYDGVPMFDFSLPSFLGEMMGQFGGGRGFRGPDSNMLPVSFLIASLNSPVYIAMPVKDAKVVDKFLEDLDGLLAELARRPADRGWFPVEFDFYKVPLEGKDQRIRCYAFRFGPVKWRMFYARLGDGLYVASKPFILEDLAALNKAATVGRANEDHGPTAHAMLRVRPEHWNKVLPDFQLGWAEGSREACINNLGPLSSVGRAMAAAGKGQLKGDEVHRQADALHAVHFFCPEGGKYEVSADGKQVTCSVHGSAAFPKQPAAPSPTSPIGRLLKDFAGATAELTFLEDGLHAVVTIERK